MASQVYLLIFFTFIDNIRYDMAFKDVISVVLVDTEASVTMAQTVFCVPYDNTNVDKM